MVVTIEKIASVAGVSKSTVSRVLNNTPKSGISRDTRERVLIASKRLNYRPNAMARALATKSSPAVGLLCQSLVDLNIMRAVDLAVSLFSQEGLHIVVSVNPEETPWEDLLNENRVGWLIAIGEYMASRTEKFSKHNSIMDRVISICDGPVVEPLQVAHRIMWDSNRAGILAIEHLFKLGHRNIAILAGPFEKPDKAWPRITSSYNYGRQLGVNIHWVTNADEDTNDIALSGQIMTAKTLQNHPDVTALICRQDYHALGVFRELHRQGVKVPQDISVLGHFDLQDMLAFDPKLTSVVAPLDKSIECALDYIVGNEKKKGASVDLTEFYRLIPRESTSKPIKT